MRIRHFPGSALLFDFGSQSIDSYIAQQPALDLRDYLNGSLIASGGFHGLSGRMEKRFTIDMVGSWTKNQGKLEESFRYDDGDTGTRCWEIAFSDNEHFIAQAHDVEGIATGVQKGNAAVMQYRLKIKRARNTIVVDMEDWFYLMETGVLINQARMAKFGFKVGEIVACFTKSNSSRITRHEQSVG